MKENEIKYIGLRVSPEMHKKLTYVAKYDDRGADCFEEIDKWEFYDKTKEKSSVVIMTSEKALYANIILKKGVV